MLNQKVIVERVTIVMAKNVLMVVTSHSKVNNEAKTGLWLSEFAEAYIEFQNKGYNVTIASVDGGKPPIDEGSVQQETRQEILDAEKYLEETVKVDTVSASDFDAIFIPGGHGAMFDLPESQKVQELIREFYEADKYVASVCHGPAALVNVTLSNGEPLVSGKRVNAFTDAEEEDTGLTAHMPFLLESRLRELGAEFVTAPNWTEHVESDGFLITGQNPQSTEAVAKEFVQKLGS